MSNKEFPMKKLEASAALKCIYAIAAIEIQIA